LIEGVLGCTNPACLREYPILDGIPLLVSDIRSFVRNNLLALGWREDLSECTESILGDCCGPGSGFDTIRQHLSYYAWDHYADRDPGEAPGELQPGATARLLQRGLELLPATPTGPILDIGCSVGRTSFALAEHFQQTVFGIDLNHAMLRLAARVLHHGQVRYPRRRVGLVYDRREFPVEFASKERADFWACDALALPFADASFALVVCLNVLDSIASPLELLRSLARVLQPGGLALLACPYDWSPAATPVEAWLGGHSQRGPHRGASEPLLRGLLTPGGHPEAIAGLRIVAELDDLPWQVRLHDRAAMTYRVHLVAVQKNFEKP
jgi:SAM-dependent methyltransferase